MKSKLSLILLLSLAACSPAPTPSVVTPAPVASPAPDAEACEHLQKGPAKAVVAGTEKQNAPKVANDHQRYDVTLAAVAGKKGGFARFESPIAGDVVFSLNKAVPLKLTDATGKSVPFEASADRSASCSDIKARHVAPLSIGVYYLEFGPSDETSVSLVIEESTQGGDHPTH